VAYTWSQCGSQWNTIGAPDTPTWDSSRETWITKASRLVIRFLGFCVPRRRCTTSVQQCQSEADNPAEANRANLRNTDFDCPPADSRRAAKGVPRGQGRQVFVRVEDIEALFVRIGGED